MGKRFWARAGAAYFVLLTAATIWPVYPALGNTIEPRVLGLPWSIVYVLLVVLASFAGLLGLYLAGVVDEEEK